MAVKGFTPWNKGKSAETIQGKIVNDFINRYPEWYPDNSLARIIYNAHTEAFNSPDEARASIRYYKGKKGDKHREKLKRVNPDFTPAPDKKSAPFAQPPTFSKEKKIYEIPSALKKAGFIADLQVPYHDPKAIDLTFNYLNKAGIDHLIINGDLVDFYGLSSFEKDPRERKFKHEYDAILAMLLYIKQAFPGIPIYYNLDANHEFRYARFMRTKAPEFFGLEIFELEELLMLDKFGYQYIRHHDHIRFGKLPIIHGDTVFSRGSGVSPARTLWMRTKTNMIASHVHRTSEYTDKDFHGKMTTCWTVGHLMHPNVEYCKHVDQYNQGFAILHKDLTGDFEVENKRISDYKIR